VLTIVCQAMHVVWEETERIDNPKLKAAFLRTLIESCEVLVREVLMEDQQTDDESSVGEEEYLAARDASKLVPTILHCGNHQIDKMPGYFGGVATQWMTALVRDGVDGFDDGRPRHFDITAEEAWSIANVVFGSWFTQMGEHVRSLSQTAAFLHARHPRQKEAGIEDGDIPRDLAVITASVQDCYECDATVTGLVYTLQRCHHLIEVRSKWEFIKEALRLKDMGDNAQRKIYYFLAKRKAAADRRQRNKTLVAFAKDWLSEKTKVSKDELTKMLKLSVLVHAIWTLWGPGSFLFLNNSKGL